MEPTALQFRPTRLLVLAALVISPLMAQNNADIQQILDRLDRLEKQNSALMDEVHQLRTELQAARGAPPPPESPATADALAVQQARIDEQAQSKVESTHKLPLQITGMVLFNAFSDSHVDTGLTSGSVTPNAGPATAGGTVSQSIIGIEYQNPTTVIGASLHGSLFLDLWGNPPVSSAGAAVYNWPMPRLRTADISLDWTSQTVIFGVDKPLISPYQPDSLAQVAVPPLAGAGNLWLWQPQVRFEQRLHLSHDDMLRLQAALYSTEETYGYVPTEYASTLESTRPGWEGRLEFAHRGGDEDVISIASGYHFSVTHVAGESVNSSLFSFDGQLRVARWWNLKGTFFAGENATGLGAAGQGFTLPEYGSAMPVHTEGGWMQLTLAPTSRLSFHLFGGEQSSRRSDLLYNALDANAAYAANVFYQVGSNMYFSVEAGQTRSSWLYAGDRLRNQYDLGVAYLF
jgi:hypothetical protein